MMKKIVAILMLLCAALFALPTGAMALGDLVLGSATNGQFLNPTLNETDNAAYLIVTGSKILTTPAGEWQPAFSDAFDASNPNGFRRYNAAGKSVEDILALIKEFKFETPENAHIELTNTDPGRLYFNPDNRHYYRYVHDVDTEKYVQGANGEYEKNADGTLKVNSNHMKGPSWSTALSAAANETRFYRTGYLANITSIPENTFVVKMMSKEDDHIDRTIDNGDGTKTEEKLKSAWLGGTRLTRSDNGTITTTAGDKWYWVAGPEQGNVFYEGKIYDETKQKSDTTGDDQVKGFAYWNNPVIFPGVGEDQVGRADASEPNNSSSSIEKPDTEVVLMLYHQDTTSTVKDDRWNDLPDYRNTTVTGYLIEYGNDRGTSGGDSVENGVPLELVTNGGSYVTGYTPPGNVKTNMGVYLPDNTQITRVGYTLDGWCNNAELTGTAYTQIAPHEVTDTETYYAKWTPITYSITYDLNTDDLTAKNPNSAKVSYTVEDENYTLQDATRNGYTSKWYDAATGGTQVTVIDTSSLQNYVLYAQWTPDANTAYTVNYHYQNVDQSGYTMEPVTDKTGTTDSEVNISDLQTAGARTGFVLDETQGTQSNVTISGDGKTVIDIYYNRSVYDIIYKNLEGLGTAPSQTKFVYGNAVTLEDPTDSDDNDGITFDAWYSEAEYTTEITEIPAGVTADQNVYARWKKNVNVKIVWDDFHNADNLRPAGISVTLDGKPWTLTGAENESKIFDNVTVHDSNGVVISAHTPAVTLPTGCGYTKESITGSDADGYTITLKHEAQTVAVTGSIGWDDANNQDGKRTTVSKLAVNLIAKEKDTDTAVTLPEEVTTQKTVTIAEGNVTFFTGLPKYVGGKEVSYSLQLGDLTQTGNYYEASLGENNVITLTHTPLTFDLKVQVAWDGAADTLKGDVAGTLNGTSLTFNSTNNWIDETQVGLPVYEPGKSGVLMTYEFVPGSEPTGFERDTSKDQNLSFTAAESMADEVQTITFGLKRKTNTLYSHTRIFTGEGASRTESVKETTFSYGDTVTYKPDLKTGDNGIYSFEGWFTDPEYSNEYISLTAGIEPLHIYAKWTREVDVEVIWQDSNDADGLRAGAAADKKLTFIQGIEEQNLPTKNAHFDFSGLTVHKPDGDEYSYKPSLTDCFGYTIGIAGSNDLWQVTLTHEAAKYNGGKVEGRFEWEDANNQDGKRAAVVLQLYERVDDGVDTAKPKADTDDYKYSVELKPDEASKDFSFEGLLANRNGVAIKYSLIATELEDYSFSHTVPTDGVDKDKNIVKLAHTPETVNVQINVQYDAAAKTQTLTEVDVNLVGGSYTETKHNVAKSGEVWSKTVTDTKLFRYAEGNVAQPVIYTVSDVVRDDDGYDREISDPVKTDADTDTLQFTVTLKPKQYDYTLDLNGGQLPEGTSDKGKYTYGDGDELPVPTKPGNDFDGWEYEITVPNPTPDDPNATQKVTGIIEKGADGKYKLPTDLEPGSITLTAKWVPQAYKLTFVTRIENPVDQNDQPIVDIPYGYDDQDENITLPTPKAPEGWTFAGWYTDAELKTKYDAPTFYKKTHPTATTTTFYARWTKSMSATAVWDDKNNQDGLRKDVNIVLYLYETDPENLGDQVKQDTGMKFTLKTTDNGEVTHTFTGLNVHDKDGKEIKYIILPDMTPLTDEKGFSEYTIRTWRPGEEEKEDADLLNSNYFRLERNTYTKLYSVKIVWNDRNNKYGSRPEKLGIELVADGPFTEPPTTALEQDLCAANGWTHEWVAQVNPTIKLKPVVPLTYDVKIIDEVSPEYVISETNDPDNREKIFTLTLRDLLLPPTGDQSDLALWGGALTLSAAALGWLALRKKSRKA